MIAVFVLGCLAGGWAGGSFMLWRLMRADHRKRLRDLANKARR